MEEDKRQDIAERRIDNTEYRADNSDKRLDNSEQRVNTASERAGVSERRADRSELRADKSEQRADKAELRADTSSDRADASEKRSRHFVTSVAIALSIVALGCVGAIFGSEQQAKHRSESNACVISKLIKLQETPSNKASLEKLRTQLNSSLGKCV